MSTPKPQSHNMGLPSEVLGALIGKIHITRCTAADKSCIPGNCGHITSNIRAACREAQLAVSGYEQVLKEDCNSWQGKMLREALTTIKNLVGMSDSPYAFANSRRPGLMEMAAAAAALEASPNVDMEDAQTDSDSDYESDSDSETEHGWRAYRPSAWWFSTGG
jgi:hypothetical protein